MFTNLLYFDCETSNSTYVNHAQIHSWNQPVQLHLQTETYRARTNVWQASSELDMLTNEPPLLIALMSHLKIASYACWNLNRCLFEFLNMLCKSIITFKIYMPAYLIQYKWKLLNDIQNMYSYTGLYSWTIPNLSGKLMLYFGIKKSTETELYFHKFTTFSSIYKVFRQFITFSINL